MSSEPEVSDAVPSPVHLQALAASDQPAPTPELKTLYEDFEKQMLVPLWTNIGDLMPVHPSSKATPHVWRWDALVDAAARAGRLVPLGRGGERRAIALANPSLGGKPYATPTLWAAIQYLMPGEEAPEHRHTQHAFRFVLEGDGVWTVVNGDAVHMSRGDFLPQAGWNWHAHRNAATQPMAWIDGLDIPFSYYTESQFFEFGRNDLDAEDRVLPQHSRSERLWAYPGLQPVSQLPRPARSPLLAYRWKDTDRALSEQLALEDEGHSATLSPGHAAVRYADPANGRDVLPTIRVEMHRIRAGVATRTRREVGSSVCQVFNGQGRVSVGGHEWSVRRSDMFVVPSWQPFSARNDGSEPLDLFRFADTPIFEAIGSYREQVDQEQEG